jgi:hypothetical protein
MSHIAGSRATPQLAAVNLGDEAEKLALDPGSLLMRLIDRIDQVDVAVCVCRGHRDLGSVTGEETVHSIEHMFDSQAFAPFPSLDLAAPCSSGTTTGIINGNSILKYQKGGIVANCARTNVTISYNVVTAKAL